MYSHMSQSVAQKLARRLRTRPSLWSQVSLWCGGENRYYVKATFTLSPACPLYLRDPQQVEQYETRVR